MLIVCSPTKSVILVHGTSHAKKKSLLKQKWMDLFFQRQTLGFVKQYSLKEGGQHYKDQTKTKIATKGNKTEFYVSGSPDDKTAHWEVRNMCLHKITYIKLPLVYSKAFMF